MKKLLTEWRRFLTEEGFDVGSELDSSGNASQLQTVGDLRKTVHAARLAKKGKKIKSAGLSALVGLVQDAIPGGNTAATIFDIVKSAYSLPDDKKSNTALDFLNVDDKVSAIVDDSIENAFLNVLEKELKEVPNDRNLEDINVTKLLSKYIAREFDKRSVAGYDGEQE